MKKKEDDKKKKEPLVKRALKKVGEYAKEEVAHQKKKSLYHQLGNPLHRKEKGAIAGSLGKGAMGARAVKHLSKSLGMKKKREAQDE